MDTAIVMAFTGLYGASTLAVFVQKTSQNNNNNNKKLKTKPILLGLFLQVTAR